MSLELPALRALRVAGVRLIAPLAGQGELIGLLNLRGRSEQVYTADDRQLLADLATQAAVRVAQSCREQQIETQARERLEQELRVAALVQQTLLPKELPELDGCRWRPTGSRPRRSAAILTTSSPCPTATWAWSRPT